MPTNLLNLPVVNPLGITTQTNCDWIDGLEYWTADPPDGEPIDLTGIQFGMEMRASAAVATVVMRATTENGLIRVYANSWQFLIPATTMILVLPGDYVFDMLALADGYTRNLIQATVSIVQGITRSIIPSTGTPIAQTANIRRVNGVRGTLAKRMVRA